MSIKLCMTQLKKVTMSELKRYVQSNNHHFVTESKQHISAHSWTNLHTCILPPYEIYPAGGIPWPSISLWFLQEKRRQDHGYIGSDIMLAHSSKSTQSLSLNTFQIYFSILNLNWTLPALLNL